MAAPLPLSVRNNNPLNLRSREDIDWLGEVTPGGSPFEVFATPEAGWRAGMRNMETQIGRGYNTVGALVTRWAPPAENNTQAYIDWVAQAAGLRPNDTLAPGSESFNAVARAMADYESGRPGAWGSTYPSTTQPQMSGPVSPPSSPAGFDLSGLFTPNPGLPKQTVEQVNVGFERAQDRITEMLMRNASPEAVQPTLGEVGRAALRAWGSGGRAQYGDIMDAMMGQRLQRDDAGLALELQRVNLLMKQVDFLAAQGNQKATRVRQAFDLFTQGMDGAQIGQMIQIASTAPPDADPLQVFAAAAAQVKQTAGKGFTLSPGQTRYDANGNPIATAPGGNTEQRRYEVNGALVTPDGEVVYQAPAAPGKPSLSDRKIADLVAQGIPYEEAERIAYGLQRVVTTPLGDVYVVDQVTGEARPLVLSGQPVGQTQSASQAPGQQPPAGAPLKTEGAPPLVNREDFAAGTGTASKAARTADQILGGLATLIGKDISIAPSESTAAATIRAFNHFATQAILGGNASRMSNQEQQWIREILPNPDAWITSPAVERNKIARLPGVLRHIIDGFNQSLAKANLPVKERGELIERREALERTIAMLEGNNGTMAQPPTDVPANSTYFGRDSETGKDLWQDPEGNLWTVD